MAGRFGRFDFRNPGSAAVDELTRFLAQRKAEQQREFINRITMQEQARADASSKRADQQMTLQQDQFNAGLADKIYDDLMPNDVLNPESAALLTKYGRGGGLRDSGTGIAAEGRLTPDQVDVDLSGQGNLTPEQMTALDKALTGSVDDLQSTQTKATIAPGVVFSERGGPKWADARVKAQERAEQSSAAAQAREETAAANRAAAKERADADRSLKEMIARLSASGSADSRRLANQLREIQISTAQEKLETTKTEREKVLEAAKSSTQTAYDLATRLLDPNDVGAGIGAATGAYELRGFTQPAQNFNAVRDQLVAALALPNLGLLKGPMSDKDVIFVKQLATRLANTRMDDVETKKAILEAQQFLENKGAVRQSGSLKGQTKTTPHGTFVHDGNGWVKQ